MQRTPVESSNIASLGYAPETRLLEVEFKSGALYQYRDVPPHLYELLRDAASKGTFLSRFIKRDYACERLAGPHEAKETEEAEHAG